MKYALGNTEESSYNNDRRTSTYKMAVVKPHIGPLNITGEPNVGQHTMPKYRTLP